MVISELRRNLSEKLNENGVADAWFDADMLIMHALGLSRTDLALGFDQKVDTDKIPRNKQTSIFQSTDSTSQH